VTEEARRGVRLLITMGDPCGIGPEVCLKALASGRLPGDAALTVVGSAAVLERTAGEVGLAFDLRAVEEPVQGAGERGVLDLVNFPLGLLSRREPSAESGRASLDYIEAAAREVLGGRADGLVTCPISKEAIGAAGSPHPGHTEMLGELSGGKPVMLLVSGRLRVAFATTHLAFSEVPSLLTCEAIASTGRALAEGLKRFFAVEEPRIAVCALNPHAGDGGRFGDEEGRIVRPAVERLLAAGWNASGPYPSDTLFARALAGDFDGVVALYHDQGMIPIKLSGLGEVVNVTLGLPFVRTSPGHGTAYDIAGRGVADPASTVRAIRLAADMVRAARPACGGAERPD